MIFTAALLTDFFRSYKPLTTGRKLVQAYRLAIISVAILIDTKIREILNMAYSFCQDSQDRWGVGAAKLRQKLVIVLHCRY